MFLISKLVQPTNIGTDSSVLLLKELTVAPQVILIKMDHVFILLLEHHFTIVLLDGIGTEFVVCKVLTILDLADLDLSGTEMLALQLIHQDLSSLQLILEEELQADIQFVLQDVTSIHLQECVLEEQEQQPHHADKIKFGTV